jgi:ribonuclease HI
MSKYYSVRIGRTPGIYLTWKECEEQVKGYSKAKYKSFKSKEEAEEYLKEIEEEEYLKEIKEEIKEEKEVNDEEERVLNDNYNFSECINIYTDGSCINNGQEDAVGGYGVYYEDDYKKNISKKLKNKEGYKITNNRAELKAILSGLEKVEKEIEDGKEIVIHTDSMYSIQVLTNKNTYNKIKKGKEVPNKDYVKKGYEIIKEYSNIKFHHVLAHTGKKDNYSIGNDKADKLANEAIKEEIGKIILTFGKYKGENLMDVYKKDSKYLSWCIKNSKNQIHDIKLFMDTYLKLDTQIRNAELS